MRFPIKVMGYHFEESVKIQEINSDTDIELLYTSDIEDVDMKIQERLQFARMSRNTIPGSVVRSTIPDIKGNRQRKIFIYQDL
jgi:hypothetical protein